MFIDLDFDSADKMIVWILLFQGAIFSSAWGCGLEDVCRADGINNRSKFKLLEEFSLFIVFCSPPPPPPPPLALSESAVALSM